MLVAEPGRKRRRAFVRKSSVPRPRAQPRLGRPQPGSLVGAPGAQDRLNAIRADP
jgi:hypothetical protein